MSSNAINWLLKIVFAAMMLLLAAAIWYYTAGRKPHVLISAPLKANGPAATVRAVGPNEVLLLVGTKATFFDFEIKKERWSTNLAATAATATPAPKAAPKVAAATPAPAPQEKADPLLVARSKKRFAKLEKWAAELNEKRGKLKTPLQIEAFNQEAAKYHAELAAARAEAAPLNTAPARATVRDIEDADEYERYLPERVEIAALGKSVWIARGKQLTGLDRADGHVLKSVALPGNVSAIERGADELFVIAAVGNSRDVQVSRVAADNAAAQNFTVSIPPEPRAAEFREGAPPVPPTPEHRILFSANHSSLLELDVRLVERKLTEQQTISGEAGSDMEAADKKTTGGFGNDALVFAQALSREAERDATGGKEIIDESTYE